MVMIIDHGGGGGYDNHEHDVRTNSFEWKTFEEVFFKAQYDDLRPALAEWLRYSLHKEHWDHRPSGKEHSCQGTGKPGYIHQ